MNALEWDIQFDIETLIEEIVRKNLDTHKLYTFAYYCCEALVPILDRHGLLDLLKQARKFCLYNTGRNNFKGAGNSAQRYIRLNSSLLNASSILACTAVVNLCADNPVLAAMNAPYHAIAALHLPLSQDAKQLAMHQSFILKALYGNIVEPWSPKTLTTDIVKLAQATKRFSQTAPILADALEEAGETDLNVLSHLRGPYGGKYKGDYAVEAILGEYK